MSAYGDDLIAMVDQRIGLAFKKDKASGTVVSRDSTGPGALVLFDGATTAMPVKCLGNVFCRPSDRVVLDKYGSDWCITGAFVGPGFGEASKKVNFSVATTGVTSTTYVDLTDFGSFSFTKFFDGTYVRVGMQWEGFSSGAGVTGVQFGIRLVQIEGAGTFTAGDYDVGRCFMNASGDHQGTTSAQRITGLPAGTYTVTSRIRRFTGTGSLVSDANDQHWIEIDEGVRSNTPIL